jgi:hypothetical protein
MVEQGGERGGHLLGEGGQITPEDEQALMGIVE